MFRRSISRFVHAPKPTAAAEARSSAAKAARRAGERALESSTNRSQAGAAAACNQDGGRITAAATTGPHRAPRPTSSTPATDLTPFA